MCVCLCVYCFVVGGGCVVGGSVATAVVVAGVVGGVVVESQNMRLPWRKTLRKSEHGVPCHQSTCVRDSTPEDMCHAINTYVFHRIDTQYMFHGITSNMFHGPWYKTY